VNKKYKKNTNFLGAKKHNNTLHTYTVYVSKIDNNAWEIVQHPKATFWVASRNVLSK